MLMGTGSSAPLFGGVHPALPLRHNPAVRLTTGMVCVKRQAPLLVYFEPDFWLHERSCQGPTSRRRGSACAAPAVPPRYRTITGSAPSAAPRCRYLVRRAATRTRRPPSSAVSAALRSRKSAHSKERASAQRSPREHAVGRRAGSARLLESILLDHLFFDAGPVVGQCPNEQSSRC
jgi:hypothetical protein